METKLTIFETQDLEILADADTGEVVLTPAHEGAAGEVWRGDLSDLYAALYPISQWLERNRP